MTRKVHPLWWLALAGTGAWVLLGAAPQADDTGLVEAVAPGRSASAAARPSLLVADAISAGLMRAPLDPLSGRGLMAKAWVPPPPAPPRAEPQAAEAPAPPPPPPPPAGPALRLLGVVKTESPAPQVYFTLADRLVLARAGEVVDGRFRIDAVTAQKVIVTVLPEQRRIEFPLVSVPPGG